MFASLPDKTEREKNASFEPVSKVVLSTSDLEHKNIRSSFFFLSFFGFLLDIFSFLFFCSFFSSDFFNYLTSFFLFLTSHPFNSFDTFIFPYLLLLSSSSLFLFFFIPLHCPYLLSYHFCFIFCAFFFSFLSFLLSPFS